MRIFVRLALWASVLLLLPFLGQGSRPWLQSVWDALVLGGLTFEALSLLDRIGDWRVRRYLRRLESEETEPQSDAESTAEKGQRVAEQEQRRHASISQAVDAVSRIVGEHSKELAARRDELVKRERYGIPDFTDWIAEKQFFADNVIERDAPRSMEVLTRAQALNAIDAVLDGRPSDEVASKLIGPSATSSSPSANADDAAGQACPMCGRHLSHTSRTCPDCGAMLEASVETDTPEDPANQQGPQAPRQEHAPPAQSDHYARVTGRISLASLLFAITGAFAPGLGILQLSALVVGILALRRKQTGHAPRRWQAWLGTVIGAIYFVYFLVRFLQGYFGLY